MSFSDMPIGRKLAVVLVCIFVFLIGGAALSVHQSMEQDRIMRHMLNEVLVTERALERWSNNAAAAQLHAQAQQLREAVLAFKLPQQYQQTFQAPAAQLGRAARGSEPALLS